MVVWSHTLGWSICTSYSSSNPVTFAHTPLHRPHVVDENKPIYSTFCYIHCCTCAYTHSTYMMWNLAAADVEEMPLVGHMKYHSSPFDRSVAVLGNQDYHLFSHCWNQKVQYRCQQGILAFSEWNHVWWFVPHRSLLRTWSLSRIHFMHFILWSTKFNMLWSHCLTRLELLRYLLTEICTASLMVDSISCMKVMGTVYSSFDSFCPAIIFP